jgi:hypothetical protein
MTTTEQVKPVWKCRAEGCAYTTAPTEEGYNKVRGHQLAHKSMPKEKKGFCLIDENTGKILAEKLAEAVEKGLIEVKPPKVLAPKPEEKGEKGEPPEEPEKAKKPEELTKPQVSTEGIFRYTISLPADAFVLFNIAKAYGLETDGDKPFDEWVWDCIQKRFEKDYKRQLVLAPVEV